MAVTKFSSVVPAPSVKEGTVYVNKAMMDTIYVNLDKHMDSIASIFDKMYKLTAKAYKQKIFVGDDMDDVKRLANQLKKRVTLTNTRNEQIKKSIKANLETQYRNTLESRIDALEAAIKKLTS